ncbi:MAG: hypothetical protein H6737_12115 [Alphaproteobacteria bacterium]|nr:hypothetical protein [Alphaproteobacteria bacterium]
MRKLLPLVAFACGACNPNCGLPTVLDGVRFEAFGNVIDYTIGDSGAPPGQILVNGYTDLEFEWNAVIEGPIVVRIDDQPFDGEGQWNQQECGNFTVSFAGTFQSQDGSEHNFTAAANFLMYDILIEGSMAYNETWTSADGTAVGQLQARDAAVTGRQYAPAGGQ